MGFVTATVFQNEVNRLRQLAQRAAGGGEEEAAAEAEAATVEGEEGETAPAPVPVPAEAAEAPPTVNTVLPDNAVLAPLRGLLYETLSRSLAPDLLVSTVAPTAASSAGAKSILQRDVAYDAALWNFPFPEVVTLEILV